jgi:acetoacetate decarboxylase
MRKEDILKLPSMPASGPSYPAGPYRFIHREFMVITYEAIRRSCAISFPSR